MKTSLLFLLVFNVGFINVLGAGNILFVDPVLAPSHQMWNSHIVRALLKIGYNVTLIGTKTVPLIEHKNLTFFELKVRDEKIDPFLDPQELQETGMFASMYLYYDYGTVECEESLISPDLKRLIDYPKDFKFDAIVYDVSVDKCLYFLIQRFNFPPTIGTQPFLLVPSTSEAFGNVVSPSYLPNMYSKYNDVMSFPQRVMNWIGSLYDRILLKQYYEPLWYEKSKQFFGPDTIKTSIIERHFCILLCNIIQGFHYPRPVTPNIIPVGGLHIKPAKKLPEEFGEYLAAVAKSVHIECTLITGVSETEIISVRNGNFNNPSEKLKKYAACAWLHTGAVNHTGHADFSSLQKLEPEKVRGKAVKYWSDCVKLGKETGGPRFIDQMWKALICDYNADPENFILV